MQRKTKELPSRMNHDTSTMPIVASSSYVFSAIFPYLFHRKHKLLLLYCPSLLPTDPPTFTRQSSSVRGNVLDQHQMIDISRVYSATHTKLNVAEYVWSMFVYTTNHGVINYQPPLKIPTSNELQLDTHLLKQALLF